MWDPYERGDVATLDRESAAQGRTFRKRRTQKRIHCQTNDMRSRMAEPRGAQGCQLPIPDVQDYPRACRC